MRMLSEYMALPYRMEVVEDHDEGGFVVSYPCACKVNDEKAIAVAKPIWDRQVLGTNIIKWDRQTGRIMY